MKQLIDRLDEIFVKKAPFQIPDNAKEWIVKYGPWIDLVLLVFVALPLVILGLGVTFLALPFAPAAATGITLSWFFALGYFGLLIFALPGMFARKMSGWNLLFYGVILSAIGDVLSGRIINGLIGLVISLYFMMQIRSKYSN